MADGATPNSLQDLAGAFLVAMVAGGILVGWLSNLDRPDRGGRDSGDGWASDDGPHHHGWWGGDADGGHHGDSGDGGH